MRRIEALIKYRNGIWKRRVVKYWLLCDESTGDVVGAVCAFTFGCALITRTIRMREGFSATVRVFPSNSSVSEGINGIFFSLFFLFFDSV